MSRSISQIGGASSAYASGLPLLPGQLPVFGSGRFLVFFAPNTNWTVPAGVTRVRARVHAGGGAHNQAGGSSSFGAMLSATGGQAPTATVNGGLGGQGFGGDFQASGGPGGPGRCSGGGAMGSELGTGGAGGAGVFTDNGWGGGGGAVGGKSGGSAADGSTPSGGGGASPFENGEAGNGSTGRCRGGRDLTSLGSYVQNAQQFVEYWPGFAFFGGGGSRLGGDASVMDGGPGAGGSGSSGNSIPHGGFGGVGGGGGGACAISQMFNGGHGGLCHDNYQRRETLALSGDVSFREYRLIGGGRGGEGTTAGAGGGGYARGEFTVTPGQVIAITAAQQQFSGYFSGLALYGSQAGDRSGGIVVVEY